MPPASLKLCEDQALINQQTLLASLASVLRFPDYFGHNWDAAWDALSDLAWPHSVITLELDVRGKKLNEDDLEVFIDLIEEAREYWKTQDKTLRLILIG